MSMLTGLYLPITVLIVLILAARWKFAFCYRCDKPLRKSKGYKIVKNSKWLCEECFNITSIEIPGLLVKRNGALKHLKGEHGQMDPKLLFPLMVALIILTAWVCYQYFINNILL